MKKKINIIIVLMMITVLLFFIFIHKSKSFAIELSKNSSLSTELIDKVATITKSRRGKSNIFCNWKICR